MANNNDGSSSSSSSLSDALSAELEKQRLAQERREEALAINLLALLKRWEVGDEEGFAQAAAAEGAELSAASFGPPLLSTIAGAYAAAAERELAASVADYNVNVADLYPRITVDGNIGFVATALGACACGGGAARGSVRVGPLGIFADAQGKTGKAAGRY